MGNRCAAAALPAGDLQGEEVVCIICVCVWVCMCASRACVSGHAFFVFLSYVGFVSFFFFFVRRYRSQGSLCSYITSIADPYVLPGLQEVSICYRKKKETRCEKESLPGCLRILSQHTYILHTRMILASAFRVRGSPPQPHSSIYHIQGRVSSSHLP